MSDIPFGFGPSDRDPERREPGRGDQGGDPFGLGALFGGMAGGGSPEDVLGKMPLFAELQKLMNWSGGPVNWDLARQGAISQLAAGHQPTSEQERAAAAESLRLADLWLDQVTELPSGIERTTAWSRVEWVEQTQAAWAALIDPLAERVVAAMTSALPQEAAMSLGPIAGIMGRMGGLMFGAQVGQALGSLAGEVLTSTDVGLPLAPAGTGVLVPQNLASFAEGLDRPADEVRLFVALREAASQRLFAHVPWLRQQLQDAVHAYARGITIDREAIERGINEAMAGGMGGGLDPSDPESIQRLLGSGVLEPEETPEQQMALRRLETLLALVEGWVDAVVAAAAADRLPGHAALAETMRRRRASGGPAEQTFATLVGLQLRPRRLRDAATVWGAMGQQHGSAERDRLWSHPDLLPTSEDLDEPLDFVARQGLDDELAALTADDAEQAPDRPSDDPPTEDEDEDRRELGGEG
ncbi:zinc-dependent metalloprotease [Blastococcus sp. MG754426]|uniref:zinc-dependent metalloprotease n=1 Tax=unclassified Blastococcus TaxID=2619396 RepID=UPI001EEFFD24|nr:MULTISPECIES: zinc-dependent metalloprotease [unclassified Blastococcus]MCF6506076.1 zinc-dependent metalloprotease [Blastococcus sp. MG754426]MCF6512926.1 zinc-dependent metalloprotease [Blastococcus sp. MG754427]MCF6735926.1 zinc-dependent metalloprotease [Blastococcus sp. KM273129]